MAFRQVLYPNLDTDPNNPLYIWIGGKILTDWYGWCLAVVAGSYGAKGSSYSAKTAWQSCWSKHCDRNLPEGLWVPLWYEGGAYGHVVIGKRNGNRLEVYSSPYKHMATFQRFEGDLNWLLDYIGQVYGVGGFSGWSESVLDSRVIEWYDEAPRKSNEEICREIWDGKWGVGQERKRRLEEAGYNYDEIQRMIDAGIGKPEPVVEEPKQEEPKPEPVPAPEPEPEPIQVPEPNDDADENKNDDDEDKKDEDNNNDGGDMSEPTNDIQEPAKQQDQQLINGIIEEAGKGFDFPKWVKLVAYLVGDVLLIGALLIPDIVNAGQAPTIQIWAEYTSRVLLEAGVAILTVFKLIKK